MAFPTVAGKGAQYNTAGTNAISHAVEYPAGISSGDLLVLFVHVDGSGSIIWPAGFTELYQTAASGNSHRSGAAYRIANGMESGDATVVTASEQATARIWRITDWHGTTPPEVGTAATGSSANPDPPSLTPSWGAADTLWIATCGVNGGPGSTSYPSGYNDNQETAQTGGSGAAGGAQASRNLNATSEDPGTFTTANNGWTANVIAVRPAATAGGQPSMVRWWFVEPTGARRIGRGWGI